MKNLHNINDWNKIKGHQKIGEILIASGKINLIQLSMAIDMQRFKHVKIGKILTEMKILSQEDLDTALKLQKKLDNKNDI